MTAEQKKDFAKLLIGYNDFNNKEITGQELFEWIEQKIDEACKKQRDICARVFLGNARQSKDNMAIPELKFRISEIIKNAPSPKE